MSIDFSSQNYFNISATSSEDEATYCKNQKQRSKHHIKEEQSYDQKNRSLNQDSHKKQNKIPQSDLIFNSNYHFQHQHPFSEHNQSNNNENHNMNDHSLQKHHKINNDNAEPCQIKDKVSTIDRFGKFNSSLLEEEQKQQFLEIEEQLQQQPQQQQQSIEYKIHLNAYNSVLSTEELRSMQIEESNSYKILGENRIFHAKPGQLSQKINEISNKSNRTQLFQKEGTQNGKGLITQEEQKQQSDTNELNALYSIDLKNRYFASDDKQQVICRRCNQAGHFERMCVKDIQQLCIYCLGNHQQFYCNQRICFNCNQTGHIGKTCQYSNSTRCARCSKVAHTKSECGAILLNNYAATLASNKWNKNFKSIEEEWKKDDDKKMKCMKCGKRGHTNCKSLIGEDTAQSIVYGQEFQQKFSKQLNDEFKGKIINFIYSDDEDDNENQLNSSHGSINGLQEQIKQIKLSKGIIQKQQQNDEDDETIMENESQLKPKKKKKAKQEQIIQEQQYQSEELEVKKKKKEEKQKHKIDLLTADSQEDIIIHVSSKKESHKIKPKKLIEDNNQELKLNRKQRRQLANKEREKILSDSNNRVDQDSDLFESTSDKKTKSMQNLYNNQKSIKQVNEVSQIVSGHDSDQYLSQPKFNDHRKQNNSEKQNQLSVAQTKINLPIQKLECKKDNDGQTSRERSRSTQQKHNYLNNSITTNIKNQRQQNNMNNNHHQSSKIKNVRDRNIFNQFNSSKNKNNIIKERQNIDICKANKYLGLDNKQQQTFNKKNGNNQTKQTSPNTYNSIKKFIKK